MIQILMLLRPIIQVKEVRNHSVYQQLVMVHKQLSIVQQLVDQIQKAFDFNYFLVSTSDIVEQSISFVDQISITGAADKQVSSPEQQLTQADSNRTTNAGRGQSLLRSPSSKYAVPKFPAVGKQLSDTVRVSITKPEQGLLLPPVVSTMALQQKEKRTLRGALGAITPRHHFVGKTWIEDKTNNGTQGGSRSGFDERMNDELLTMGENLHQLHIRIVYDDHQNDLIVNVIEGTCVYIQKEKILSLIDLFTFICPSSIFTT